MQRMPLGVLLAVGEGFPDTLRRMKEAGFPTMQLVGPPEEWLAEPQRGELKQIIAGSGIQVTSVAAVYEGESYADVAAVQATVGLLPEETRAGRIGDTKRCADFAHEVGAQNVSSHIGYIPEDRADPTYGALVSALQEICDYIQRRQMSFCLETGQESAGMLKQFISDVGRENLKVNFDPANMIAYGTGDPIEAIEVLAEWIRGVHCKDAVWPPGEGQLGEERVLGEGEVGIERFLAKLKQIGYAGPLTIEREIAGEQQIQDFLAAKKLLEETKAKLGIQ
ncbi:MAG TPA: sugar phosphate isomerase/epimerase family protein [Armatimonadota bacterium]|nr:sugar phosphate isomerase/epimerase family protein [Armatimonadota bacterium]